MAKAGDNTNTLPQELNEIWPMLEQHYRFVEKIKGGQNALAFKIAPLNQEGVSGNHFFCLKVAKRDADPSVDQRRKDNLSKEIKILYPLNHVALPRIYEFDLSPSLPWYVSNFHPGLTLHEFAVQKGTFDLQSSMHVISTLLDVLEYVHSEGRTHCDLHSKNILISQHVIREGLLVIDFGSGHRDTDSSRFTENRGLPRVKPLDGPGYAETLDRDENRDYFRTLDIKALGVLLGDARDCFFADGSRAQISSFNVFCRRLQEDNFKSYEEAREELKSVFDPYRKVAQVNRLFESPDGVYSIHIPGTAGVDVGDKILELINTLAFQRLRRIKQLSFCDWYYPGANHTRFEHSLGVMDAVRQAISILAKNKVFRDRYSSDQLKGAVICALMHDVGHYPFAHLIEHYAASRFGEDREIKNFVSHATRSKYLLQNDSELVSIITSIGGANVIDQVIAAMDHKLGALSDLVDGPIDCDKLDYLVRDSYHCGLNYGNGIDKREFLKRLRCVGNCERLGVDRSGVAGIEGFMVLQDQMLSSVYWHEFTRGIICMFHAALAHIVKTNKEDFKILVDRIRDCMSEQEALQKVILPAIEQLKTSDPKAAKAVTGLLDMHLTPSFSGVYRPIASYRHSDPESENQLQTVFQKLSPRQTFTESNTAPVNWKNVGVLRKCYIGAFDKYGVKGLDHEVLIDVPIGKAANRMVSVLLPDGTAVDITSESHLNHTIFTQPAIFASPVRVYIAPELHRKLAKYLKEIVSTAEKEFLEMKDVGPQKTQEEEKLGQRSLSFETRDGQKKKPQKEAS